MTKRELELARRHLEHLETQRDRMWSRVLDGESYYGKPLAHHEALVYAIGLVQAEVQRGEAVQAAEAAAA